MKLFTTSIPLTLNGQSVSKYRVQQRRSAKPNATFRDELITSSRSLALEQVRICRKLAPGRDARVVVETYLINESQLAKRVIWK